MLLPTHDNQVGYELCHATVPFNVNVDRLMLLTVKEEGESKESKYFWHISISFYSDCAKIGIIFDTNNFFAEKRLFLVIFRYPCTAYVQNR